MTVTEKAYGILRSTGTIDISHPAISHDLENRDAPTGVLGFLVKGLLDRFKSGKKPFTVLCCDNLPQNGDLVRSGVLSFAEQIGEQSCRDWLADNGAFPNTMVDRITPATTPALIHSASKALGCVDGFPIETEAFSQWVVEDKFSDGRPSWEDVGVLFVEDVTPYEKMKLRMLNGAHSLIAYVGFLSGNMYVRDVMAEETYARIVSDYIGAAARTLEPLKGIDLDDYADQLIERFANPNIAHETFQIAMDGSQKMPQRVFETACDALSRGNSVQLYALAVAAWMRYCSGEIDGKSYEIRDPRQQELTEAFSGGGGTAEKISKNFHALPDLFPAELTKNETWREAVVKHLSAILQDGIGSAIENIRTPDNL